MESKQLVWMLWSAGDTLIANMGDVLSILQMLAVLISGTQITTKETTLMRNTNGKNELEQKIKLYFTSLFRAVLHKEGIEKEWKIFRQDPLNLIKPAHPARITLKKG